MLTNNFKNIFKSFLSFGGSSGGTVEDRKTLYPLKNMSGTTYYYQPSGTNFPSTKYYNVVKNNSTGGIAIGSGTTQPTENDYNLDSMITTCDGTVLVGFGDDDGNNYIEFKMIVSNTASSAITVNEIGWVGYTTGYSSQGSTSSTNIYCLLDRTLLNSPVTIEPDESSLITYRITLEVE